jgi:hypothetical protein
MEAIYGIVAILIITFSLSFASNQDGIEAESQVAEYQQMVCLGRKTNSELGHPNFKNLKIKCNKENENDL